ncbi:MAG: mechanosensitive ion channel domain-containing protein [Hyphomicrobiaceae bacterium]
MRDWFNKPLRDVQRAALACVFVFAWMSGAAAAQANAPAETSQTTQPATAEHADVTLDGRTLFRVRGVMALPAERRAREIRGRIQAIAADPSVRTDSLRVAEIGLGSSILAGERPVMAVVDADAAFEGISRHVLAELYRKRIAEAIVAYRSDRDPRVLLTHSGYALGATLALAVLLFAVRRAYRWLDALASRRLAGHIEKLEQGSVHLIKASQLRQALHGAFKTLRVVLTLIALYLYLDYVLGLYPWTRPGSQALFGLLVAPLRVMGAALVRDIPDLVFLVVLFVVTRYVLKLARLFFSGIEQGGIRVSGMDSEVAGATYKIVRLLIVVFAVVVAYPYIPGSDSDAFKGISLLLGLVFSLGSSSVIGNLIAGYTMIYRRAFKIGDRIKVGEVIGDVLERRLMVTRLRTVKNEEVVIPNSEILNSSIFNFSSLAREQGLILHTTIGIGYETPWRQVEAMLRMAAGRTPGLLATPEPFVLQKALGDFCVTYEINVYCDQPQGMNRIYTDLHRNILDVFNEYGVQIMTPAYEGDAEQPKLVPKARWYEAPAAPPPATQDVKGGEGFAAS